MSFSVPWRRFCNAESAAANLVTMNPWLPLLSLLLVFLQASQSLELPLWPWPQFVEFGEGPPTALSDTFHIQAPPNSILQLAAARYKDLILKERWLPLAKPSSRSRKRSSTSSGVRELQFLRISVTDLDVELQHGVDESYSIHVPELDRVEHLGLSAVLSAETVWGALRGLETFSQLVVRVREGNSKLFVPHTVDIVDEPLFPHRGLLLDTSRNFYPVDAILRTVRAMAHNKMNVFHWHITDSHSFPLRLSKEPELADLGAYGFRETYSREDVAMIVEFGRVRGVRVIPELDMPGHTGSWAAAYPEIVTCHGQFWLPNLEDWSLRFAAEPGGVGQLNPLHPQTYKVVKNVINEVADMFPDNFFHGGGDEVTAGCWNNSTDIQKYVEAGGSMSDLLEKFVTETHAYIKAKKKIAVYWEDIILDDLIHMSRSALPKETVILQTWNKGPANTKILTSAGYRTIVSSSDFYYLDCGHGGWVGNDSRYDQQVDDNPSNSFNYGGTGGSWCAPYKTWARIYSYDITFNLTEGEAALVLGGEVALWSEQADETVLDSRLWPRAAAAAESLWSGNKGANGVDRASEALTRLNDWRYRLVARGIHAEPLQPLWCVLHPGGCNINS